MVAKMKKKRIIVIVGVLIVTSAIIFTLINMARRNPKIPVRVIFEDFVGFGIDFPTMDKPIVIDVKVAQNEKVRLFSYSNENRVEVEIDIKIIEVKEDIVVVEITTNNLFPTRPYIPWEKNPYNYPPGKVIWVDEIPKNRCYELMPLFGDLYGWRVYLTFDLEKNEKHMRCGDGKVVFVWYEEEEMKLSIVKDNRVGIWYDDAMRAMEEPMSPKEIMDFIKENDCVRCVSLRFIEEEIEDYRRVRRLTAEEEELVKSLYPEFTYCR